MMLYVASLIDFGFVCLLMLGLVSVCSVGVGVGGGVGSFGSGVVGPRAVEACWSGTNGVAVGFNVLSGVGVVGLFCVFVEVVKTVDVVVVVAMVLSVGE
jgi:hypothetical protein